MFTHFTTSLFKLRGKHLTGKTWAWFSHSASFSRYLFARVAFCPRHPHSASHRICPRGLSGRPPLPAPALQKLWFVGSLSYPLAEVWASRKSVTSQEVCEGDSFCLPCICSSYSVSTGLCSSQAPLTKISTSWRVRLFIIWKELSQSAGKSRVSFRNVLTLLFGKVYC